MLESMLGAGFEARRPRVSGPCEITAPPFLTLAPNALPAIGAGLLVIRSLERIVPWRIFPQPRC